MRTHMTCGPQPSDASRLRARAGPIDSGPGHARRPSRRASSAPRRRPGRIWPGEARQQRTRRVAERFDGGLAQGRLARSPSRESSSNRPRRAGRAHAHRPQTRPFVSGAGGSMSWAAAVVSAAAARACARCCRRRWRTRGPRESGRGRWGCSEGRGRRASWLGSNRSSTCRPSCTCS